MLLDMSVHLSIDGHLGLSCLLAVVNNAATNVGMRISESLLSVPLGINPEVGLQGHMVVLCLLL